jgi:hypothetical protein
MENDFEKFCETVKDFWPRCKTSPPELHGRWVDCCSCYGETDILKKITLAFKNCKSVFPNPPGPNWEGILADLRTRTVRRGNDAFRELLEETRVTYRSEGSGNWADEELWLRMLRSYVWPITHWIRLAGPIGQRVIEQGERETEPCTFCLSRGLVDCGLTDIACKARRFEENERCRWRRYLEDRGETVPSYLLDSREECRAIEPQPSENLF